MWSRIVFAIVAAWLGMEEAHAESFLRLHQRRFPVTPEVVDLATAAAAAETGQVEALYSLLRDERRRLVLELVAGWCGPCRASHPKFVKSAVDDVHGWTWAVLALDDEAPGGPGVMSWVEAHLLGGSEQFVLPSYVFLDETGRVLVAPSSIFQQLIEDAAAERLTHLSDGAVRAGSRTTKARVTVEAKTIEDVARTLSTSGIVTAPLDPSIMRSRFPLKCIDAPLAVVLGQMRKGACIDSEVMSVGPSGGVVIALWRLPAPCESIYEQAKPVLSASPTAPTSSSPSPRR